MSERSVMASVFKEQCLALLEVVANTKESILVTKRGRPMARLVAIETDDRRPLAGSVELISPHAQDYYSAGETWSVEV
ncbi:MAG: type II toxin-antitoxin system Phd/YefM family antitoxin [Pseudonocardiaceae bacterium]